jgi:hypothetical protein
LQAELGNDAINGSFAGAEATLAEFLSNDLGTGIGVEKSMADHLADEFLATSVVGFRTSFGAEQSLPSLFEEEGLELKVTLAAETEFGSGTVNAFRAAFTLDEHGEFKGDFIIVGNGQGAESALETFLEQFQRNHRDLLERVPQLVQLFMAQYSDGIKYYYSRMLK